MGSDLRKFAVQTNKRLLVGFVGLLIFIGDGLIYAIYGQGAAIIGILCILAGLFPLVLIWGILKSFEWIASRADDG